jgi:sodium/hydrogen antiporter
VTLAADSGFTFAETYAIGALLAGLAVFAAVGALSHERERAFSASLIYLALGTAAALVIGALDLDWLEPVADAAVYEHAAEAALVIALFATGMKLDRPLSSHAWASVGRLLIIAMPLTIAAIALFGTLVMGLTLGGAIALGACLAPTDPVLAGDVGVGPPGEQEEEREPRFAITGEAGLNDGLAFPFLLLGVVIAEDDPLLGWAVADVVYAISVGVAIGAAAGYGLGALAVRLRDRRLLAKEFDGWLAPAAVLVIYGLCEVVGGYGFLAAFAGGVAFRRYEAEHEYNARVHEGAEVIEKFTELALILLLGSSLTLTGLGEPGVAGWALVALLLLVIRPAAAMISLTVERLPGSERAFVAWFGVRGIGSLYYIALAVGLGAFSAGETARLTWTVFACIVVSIVVHGVTASPLSRRWLSG